MLEPNKLQDLVAIVEALLQKQPVINNRYDLVALLVAAQLQQQQDNEVITASQFCEELGFKPSYIYKLKKDKCGAPLMIANNRMRRGRMREWLDRREQESVNGPARLAYERRQVQASKAGKIGAGNPNHPHPRGSGKKSRKKRS